MLIKCTCSLKIRLPYTWSYTMISAAVHLCSQNRQLWEIWKFYRKASATGSRFSEVAGVGLSALL